MPSAIKRKVKYTPDGKRPREVEWEIGAIVVVGIVVVVLCLTGHMTLSLPVSIGGGLWSRLFK